MKIWERRLMKDFQVAPIESQENGENSEAPPPSEENPLDRFRRIGKQVASQSTTVKWSEVIRSATIEANSQIGRCRNRESFRNQQNLLKAMEQARKLIDRSPLPQSPAHSDTYSIMNQTNETLMQLLKNISEEINEISPSHTLKVTTPKNRSVTPLQSLNVQLQSIISSKNPSPYQTKEKVRRPSSPRPPVLNLKKPDTPKEERIFSPPPKPSPDTPTSPQSHCNTPKSPKSRPETPKSPSISRPDTPKSPKSPGRFELSKSPLSKPPTSILKNRSPTPDNSKSLDDAKSDDDKKVITKSAAFISMPSIEISSECDNQVKTISSSDDVKPQSPTLINLNDSVEIPPLTQVPGSPIKVVKRKAPIPVDQSQQDISISRPVVAKAVTNQGMIPPPPSKIEEVKVMQIPILSTTPATPLPSQKQFSTTPECNSPAPPPLPTSKPPAPEPPCLSIISDSNQSFSSTEALVTSNDPGIDANRAASSPPCLRPVNKIEDVKTIKRQMKTGWL